MSDSDPSRASIRRTPTNTEAAIDEVVESAAGVVARTLDNDGVPPARVTAEDVWPAGRRPLPSASEQPTEKLPVETLARRSAQLDVTTPSLSPFEIAPRERSPRSAPNDAPTRGAPDHEAAIARVPYPSWILAVMALVAGVAGGAAAVTRLQMPTAERARSLAAPPPALFEIATEVRDASSVTIPVDTTDAGAARSGTGRAVGQPDR